MQNSKTKENINKQLNVCHTVCNNEQQHQAVLTAPDTGTAMPPVLWVMYRQCLADQRTPTSLEILTEQ